MEGFKWHGSRTTTVGLETKKLFIRPNHGRSGTWSYGSFWRLFDVLVKKCVISVVLVGKLVLHARHHVKNGMVSFVITRNRLKKCTITMILMKVVILDILLIHFCKIIYYCSYIVSRLCLTLFFLKILLNRALINGNVTICHKFTVRTLLSWIFHSLHEVYKNLHWLL